MHELFVVAGETEEVDVLSEPVTALSDCEEQDAKSARHITALQRISNTLYMYEQDGAGWAEIREVL